MKKNIRSLLIIISIGSFWGFLEVLLGDMLRAYNLPGGEIMAVIAVSLMVATRMAFKSFGYQIIMGIIAMTLRCFNPFGSCLVCGGIAIMAEAVVFELLWPLVAVFKLEKEDLSQTVSFGFIVFFLCYSLGYIVTQVMTPLFANGLFMLDDLVSFLPVIIAKSLIPGIIGGFIMPVLFYLRQIEVEQLKPLILYPAASVLTACFWIIPQLVVKV